MNFFRINIYDIIFDCANDISELNGIYKNWNTYFDIAVNEWNKIWLWQQFSAHFGAQQISYCLKTKGKFPTQSYLYITGNTFLQIAP